MRVLICPDKFAGTLTAARAADAIAAGWLEAAPDDAIVRQPLADGGPGFLDVLAGALAGTVVPVATCDPLGRPVDGQVLVVDDTAYVESAQACGLDLLAPGERDPLHTTSYGLGLLMAAAVETGARTVVVGLGGSATNDAGAGMLAALGAAPVDDAGLVLPYGGAALVAATGLTGPPRLREVSLVAATDVDNPLTGPTGASAVFGPQKGASVRDVTLLDAALGRFAGVLERSLPRCPEGLAALPGGGAAGGLGSALLALGGRRESGAALVRSAIGFDAALATADVVVTGEGRFDEQSLRGKVVGGVAAAAAGRGVPCLVLAGQVAFSRDPGSLDGAITPSRDPGSREGPEMPEVAAHSVAEHVGGVTAALTAPADGLRSLAAQIARQWRGSHMP